MLIIAQFERGIDNRTTALCMQGGSNWNLPRNIPTILGTSAPGGSSGPASSNKTFHSGMSLSLDATTAPADPPNSEATKVIKVLSLYSANRLRFEKNVSATDGDGEETSFGWNTVYNCIRRKESICTTLINFSFFAIRSNVGW